ncbi:hypothetical protein C1637_07935 [Chryseobacterium lactis]|uniref:Uncharacterized protein n=1 Tax=Chryseobacterium lactis TaxID=1241981 RepID=A0A3G6RMZ5_CHRLC|nr:hypothetical protein EG342_11760 [Chryseobacterium lactis]AZB02910.1 hypothetical protein EG341_02620 [Chryseobacterium lactis]PNW13795.1 hypothetical protein C1637_07935 [Chryseobacterium lactis]
MALPQTGKANHCYLKPTMNKSRDLELTFLNFISETMNVKAVNLYKMDSNGTNYEIKLNDDKKSKIRVN